MTEKRENKPKNLPERKQLSAEAIEARREYYRQYYRRNAGRRKAWNDSHWERLAAQQAEEGRED